MDVANGSSFGLLAGTISEGSSFNNVKISGKLLFTDNCSALVSKSDAFSIGLISASGSFDGISYEEGKVTAGKTNEENQSFNVEINDDGSISLTTGSN